MRTLRSQPGRHRAPVTHEAPPGLGWVVRTWRRTPALKSIFSMATLSVAQTACNALIALICSISLGPAGRGVMVVGMTLGSFMAFAGGLGTGPALRSRYAAAGRNDGRALISAYIWWTVVGTLGGPLLTVAAAVASAGVIDPELANPFFLVALAVYTASQIVMNQFVEAWYAGGRYAPSVGSAAAMGAASLTAVLACLAIARTPAALLLAQGLGAALVCVVVGV